MAKRKPPPKAQVPEWVVTFGDLMALLLCFFVLLMSFSEIKKPKEYQEVVEAFQQTFGSGSNIGISPTRGAYSNSRMSRFRERVRWDGDQRQMNENADPAVAGVHDRSAYIQEGILRSIGASVLFEPGSFELSRDGREVLRTQVAPRISGIKYISRIVGHAWGDADRRSGLTFEELGWRRAMAVRDYLVRECGVDESILRPESAGMHEPVAISLGSGQDDGVNRRVQVYQSGRTSDQVHPDPNFTGTGRSFGDSPNGG